MSSPVLGAGLAPAGTSFAGFGAPATADALVRQTLPQGDGTTGTGRLIDTRGDYVIDANGNVMGMGSAAQLVVLALAPLKPTGVISEAAIATMKGDITDALKPLVARGLIAVKSIAVTRVAGAPTRVQRAVTWVDTQTSYEQTTIV